MNWLIMVDYLEKRALILFLKMYVCFSFIKKPFYVERGVSTLYEIYIGFCPRIDFFYNIMHIDCLTYDYLILI